MKPAQKLVFYVLMDLSLTLGLLIFFVPELAMLRNHVGDVAAVVFIFSALTMFIKRTRTIAIVTLSLSVGLELIQALKIFENHSTLSELVLGHTFDIIDLTIYILTTLALTKLHIYLSEEPAN